MKKRIHSHSSLSTFEQCPQKYKYRYIEKIKPEFKMSIEAHLGKSVHDTLEWIYNSVINENKTPKAEEIINYYSQRWIDTLDEDMKKVNNFLSEKDYFNKGVQFLMNYYTKYSPFKDGTLECEKRILINLDGHQLQGFIDRLVFNEKKNEIEIHDYKTGNFLPSREQIEQDRQLALYSIAIQELFGGDKKICLTWHYLAHNQKICLYKTQKQIEQLKNQLIELIKKIESTEHFPHYVSKLCDWCEYKYACPAWGNKLKEKQAKLKDKEIENLEIWD